MVRIRQYRDADRAGLEKNLIELEEHIAALDPLGRTRCGKDFDAVAYTDRLLERIAESESVIFVAEDGSVIIGIIAGIIPEKTLDDTLEGFPSKDGRILELYVHPDARGKDIGRKLMRTMEEHFRSKGCTGCHVDCFAPNHGPHAFYHKCGYADRQISLLKIL